MRDAMTVIVKFIQTLSRALLDLVRDTVVRLEY